MPYSSNIQIVNDANGTAYAFLADNGAIWQCQWDPQAQLWAKGQLVPLAFGGEKLQTLYLSNLWPAGSSGSDSAGSTPGIVLAYRVGEGAGAEVYASFGQWGSDGLLGWSQPQQLTDDQVEDQAFSLVQGEQGGFSLVVQKQQAGANSTAILDKIKGSDPSQFESALAAATSAERPDSDLYVNQYNLTQAGTPLNPSWQLTSPKATAKDQLIVWAPKEASSAASPLSLSGNTQLSRQELYPATTTTGSVLAGKNEVALMGVSATSSVPQSGWSWQGGAAAQFNSKNGSSLRLGVMPGLDPLRWQLRYPATIFTNNAEGFGPLLVEDNPFVSEFGKISDAAADLLNPVDKGGPVEAAISDAAGGAERIADVSSTGGSFRTGTRYVTYETGANNNRELDLFLKGMFGLSNLGQGGPTSISSAKLGFDFGNSGKRGVASKANKTVEDGASDYISGESIGLGGALRTVYQYDNMNPGHLTGMTAAETISIDFDYTGVKLFPGGSTFTVVGAADVGYSWEQSVDVDNGYLPAWLGYIGWTGGLAADLAKKAAMGYGLKDRSKIISKFNVFEGEKPLEAQFHSNSAKNLGDADGPHQTAAALVGSAMAALGPATALVVEQSGKGLDGATFENTRGEEIFTRLTGRYLWHSLVGLQATVGNKYNANWAGVNKGNWQDTFFAIAGIAFPLGSSISLLNYHHTWTHPKSNDDDTSGVGATQSASAGSASGGDGFYAGAPTGNDYPFLYTPSTASNSYFAPTASIASFSGTINGNQLTVTAITAGSLAVGDVISGPGILAGTTITKSAAVNGGVGVYTINQSQTLTDTTTLEAIPAPSTFLLGTGQSESLQFFTLSEYAGLVNYTPPKGSSQIKVSDSNISVTLFNAGKNLIPGTYTNVPLLGITAGGTEASGAYAAFTVDSAGNILASSFQITTGGQYLHLPETEPNNGIYALMPDVFSTGIAIAPDPTVSDLGNTFRDLPLITIASASANSNQLSPLTTQPISRVQAVEVKPASQPTDVIYPNYDPSTDSATPPAADNNSPYTYSNVAVQLLAAPTTALTSTTAVSLLNPGAVTATVHLSAGVIQRVELDQPLLFVPVAGTEQYSIQLTLPDAVLNTLPPSTTTSFDVDTEQAAFNNFVADDQFSAQPGLANAGVYIAAGISDQIPLYASMGRWPVQNRVSYVTDQETVYLNGMKESTASGVYVAIKEVTQSDLYPSSIYNDSEIFFSAASSPTAIAIAGNESNANDTFVAWVEASTPVIPITTGDGESNFQSFMDDLYGSQYGSQRINFRIKTASGWEAPILNQLYTPEIPSIIRHLKAFNVKRAGSPATLLVWTETSIDAIKGAVAEIGSGPSVQSVIKTGWINPAAPPYQWSNLVTDIATILWDPSTDVGLTINDITIGSLPYLQSDNSIVESPLVSWSQDVRTPYRQSVLNDDPLLYLQFGDLQSGYNAINIGSVKDPTTTGTQASSTGLNFAIAGALSKSQASAVQNTDGTGVLSTGLGSMYAPIRDIVNNLPAGSLASSADSIASFSGTINGTELTVTAITAGSLAVGDVISGPGILAGTTITKSKAGNGGVGVYTIDQSQTLTDTTTLEAIPAPSTFPLSSFSGAISGNTLTVDAINKGLLQLGDQLIGEGVAPGTFITAVNTFDANQGTGTYTVSIEQTVPDSALVAIPGQPTTPYTIEFWAQLAPGSNTAGAGLVAFGQPSSTAVGAATAPDGWLLSSSFVVDYVTYQQAAAQSLIPAIPTGTDPSSLYGWAWGVVADGANTTAMNGSGGSNLYSNALQINNLVSGASLDGINQFLANYQLTSSDLAGIDNTNADTIAAVPTTQLQFDHALDSAGQPVSSLNNIAIDTSSALLNQGFILASDLDTDNPNANSNAASLSAMFGALWDFQQKTGEAKVNLSLAPDSNKSTTTANGQLPDGYTSEQYAGYELDFSLQNGVAVSVNGSGQLVFDFGNNSSITTNLTDLRDNQWHYIAATYLPTYQSYNVNGTVAQLPTNVGTASLYVNNKLAASQSNVFNAYAPINLNDQALLLANNVSGAIDQLAFYDKALTPSSFTPNTSGQWPMPTTEDALALLAAMGYGIDTKTPDPGAIPGAVSSHWLARNVNPNDALLGTYYSVFTPDPTVSGGGSWSQASNLNPSLAPQATIPSASRPGSLQNDLVISVPVANWANMEWLVNDVATASVFNPAGQQLVSVSVTLTNASDATDTSTVTLSPEQVLLGSNSLLSLQPQGISSNDDTNYQYFVPTNLPAFNLVIDKGNLSSNQEYKATYTFTFITPSTTTGKTTVTNKTPITINAAGSAIGNILNTGVISADSLNRVETFSSAIATAAVIEQAPLQLKYIDSGEVFKSASSLAAANSPANSTPANSFGQSQVYGSFGTTTTGTNSGWLAIAQPLSANASSNPAGRVWINFTGNFTLNSDGSHKASTTAALAPNTWLNALAESNFSPDSPNLPLLGAANYASNTGGLLIQADPTVGWGNNFGQNMLAADVNNDGIKDLVIAAPQANGGGRVYIISGEWIQDKLTSADGGATLDLANPDQLGDYVTVLTASTADSADNITVAGFGTALAYDTKTNTLWIGAPNYLSTIESSSIASFSGTIDGNKLTVTAITAGSLAVGDLITGSGVTAGTTITTITTGNGGVGVYTIDQSQTLTDTTALEAQQVSLQPIGALYGYNYGNLSSAWGTGVVQALENPILGSGGTVTTFDSTNAPITTFWGSQFGAAIATNSDGAIAISAPGFNASMIYSGTNEVGKRATLGGNKNTSTYGDGALLKIQLPDSSGNVAIASGVSDSTFVDIANQDISKKSELAKEESAYMQNLKALQVDNIADATEFYNQAFQTDSVGAVYLFSTSTDLQTIANSNSSSSTIKAELVASAAGGGATFYGPNPWNVLGASGFGSSLALSDLKNTNSSSTLAIGASQTGGSGALYLVDTQQAFTKPQASQPDWLSNINTFGSNQYLAHLASSTTLYGAASLDYFANGLVNLGDVNADGYDDLLIQAFNASSGAGNGYVLFGSDQVMPTTPSGTPNPATGSVAPGSIGSFKRADGTSFTTAILTELGNGSSAYTGQGSFGAGDVNSDGLNDIPLGSGPNGSSYLTWGHPYLEAITNLQLSKLASNTGYLLDGLATSTQGSLRSIGDFNGDGYGDFISINPGNALTTVRIELGANTQEILADYAYEYYTFTVANGTEVLPGGDINGDGMDDIVLFLDQNLSSAADGNKPPGSSTGILYGRNSDDLPLGSGFGFIAMVDPTTNAPLAPLPGDALGTLLTDAAPSVIAVGNTLYAAVKGNSPPHTTLWFTQSTDGGNTWNSWTDLSSSIAGFSTSTGPSLAFYNEKLYLSFLNTDSTPALSLSSWDPTSNNPAAWSTPYELSNAANPSASYSSKYSPQLIDRGDALGVVWVDASTGTLASSYSTAPDQSTTPGSWSTPTELLQRTESDSGVSFVPISATEAPSASWLGGVPVLALNNNGTINVYAGAQSGGSLELTSSFTASSGEPAISSAPVLTTSDTGLALTYTNSDGSITLQRLNFVSSNGAPLQGVQFNPDGSINTSNADLQWQSTILTESNSGISSSLASTPVSVNGNLLLTNVRNTTSQDSQIWINAVPNASDPDSTTWLNSTIQLPDSSSGWSISQQTGTVNIGTFTPHWTGDNGGLSPSAPAFAELNGVLYAAVVGDDTTTDSDNGLLYWNSSSDGGQTWSSWQQVLNGYSNTTTNPTNIAYAGSYQAPSLTAFDGAIYMGYVGTNNDIYIASLTDTEVMVGDSATNYWTQVQVSNQECQYIAITSENGELAAYYVGTGTKANLYRTATSNPTSGSGWSNSMLIQYSGGDQTASGNLAVTTIPGSGSSSDTTYIAYQGGTPSSPSDTLYLTYSSTQSNGNSSSWSEASISTKPSTANRGGVTLSHNSAGLLLGYPDKLNDELVYVVQQSANSGSTWSSFTTLAAPTGSSLPSSGTNNSFSLLASANSNAVLVGAINNGTDYNNAINTTIVSELPTSTSLSSSQTQSTLSAVGDLNGDGFDDLLVAANNVVVNPSSSSPTLATGLRLISGAATSSQILDNNNPSSSTQNVQLAPWQGLSNSTPVASLSGNGQLTVTSTDSQSGRSQSNSATLSSSAAFTATAGDTATAQQLFQPNAAFTLGQPTAGIPLGDLALISTAGFGDLNGDGYEDYLDPTSATVITGANSQSWTLWSIRAAGDVNGNGVDDVLLSLAPQGPAYVSTSAGSPTALQSVLLDGSLFKIDTGSTTFSLSNLRTPLDPYNRGEIYDVSSTSSSQYVPLLQNWFDPILNFEPGSLKSSSVANSFNPAGAMSYSPPSVAISPQNEIYLLLSGFDNFNSNKNSSGLWMAYQQDGIWSQMEIQKGNNASSYSPSAAFYEGNLYVAYSDVSGNIWVAYSNGNPEEATSWQQYQVKTSTTESTTSSPTLIAEQGRLAMYFPSNNGTNSEYVRYLYSNDPGNLASGSNAYGNWGGSYGTTGVYSGSSGQMNFSATKTIPAGPTVTSPIAATTFQGRTVLAFRDYNGSVANGQIILATQDYSQTTGSAPSPTAGWKFFNTGISNVNGVGLTTDQSLLYLTASGDYADFTPTSTLWSLSSADSNTWNTPTRTNVGGSPSLVSEFTYGVINPFVLNGELMAAWTNSSFDIQVSNLDVSVNVPTQQSLAGYSIDGNIDVNGDGFTDILISDPSDPSEGVNNQYVLFGGDYLNIASQVGTAGNDTLIGTPLADVIYTLSGADEVISNGGADVIYTGSGDDQISITDNAFFRIDAGSGFDKLLLEGGAGQDYDFSEYFAGTKLRNIELISSVDYGSNTLSFDAAVINAINPDRVLFVTPDASDIIALSSEFQRNRSFDTNYGGVLWNAYAAGEQTSPTSDSPALVYVLNPEGATNANWLSTNVTINTATASSTSLRALSAAPLGATDSSSESAIPTTSAVYQSVSFGSGLSLTSYRTKHSDGEARFSVSSSDTSKPRALLYAISSANSSAEPGLHYKAIAGVAVLAKGQSSFDITVPINGEAFSQLRKGTLSLRVEEITYSDQLEPIHLLIEPTPAADGGPPPVLSGLSLNPGANGSTATLEFRADTTNGSADTLNFSIARRNSANSVAVSQRRLVSINDFKLVPGDLTPAYNLQNLDHDNRPNQQVQTSLLLNLKPTGNDPLVSLLGPELNWQITVQLLNGNQVRFQQDAPLTSWRADSGAGLVTFGLQSGSNNLNLISNAQGGSAGSLNSNNANGATSWQSTEGKAIGSCSITEGQNLKGSDWTPTASLDGVSLALLNLAVDGNQVTATFSGGVTGVFWQADGNAPSLLPVPVAVEVQRLAGYNNSLGFYSVDSITGMVAGINPGETGYLQAALARSQEEDLLLDARTLPAFGATATFNSLPLDTRERYGVLLLQNGDESKIFSSFAAANEGGATQMVSLSNSSNSLVLGIEDMSVAKGLGDNDFNDIIVKIQGVSLGLF